MNFAAIEEILGMTFMDKSLIESAFTHRSYLNENRHCTVAHNERLEFLGDAVLELATTEHLYLEYPNKEGELTNFRSALVNYKALAEIFQELGLECFIRMSRGQLKDNGRSREVILANCMEAVIGAMYLEVGFEYCREFIRNQILVRLPKLISEKKIVDPKSVLQEVIQAQFKVLPVYSVVKEQGPDHDKSFVIQVLVKGKLVGVGKGASKKESELAAAEAALKFRPWQKW